jgi:hypothetical protein
LKRNLFTTEAHGRKEDKELTNQFRLNEFKNIDGHGIHGRTRKNKIHKYFQFSDDCTGVQSFVM